MFIIFQKEGPCLLKWCLTFRASWRRYTFAACYIIYIYIHVSESLNHGRPPSSNLHGVLYKEIQQKNSHLQFQERMRRSTELLQLFSQAVESTRVMQQATQEWSLCFIAGRTTHTHTHFVLYINNKARSSTSPENQHEIQRHRKIEWFVFPFPKPFEVEMWVFQCTHRI